MWLATKQATNQLLDPANNMPDKFTDAYVRATSI